MDDMEVGPWREFDRPHDGLVLRCENLRIFIARSFDGSGKWSVLGCQTVLAQYCLASDGCRVNFRSHRPTDQWMMRVGFLARSSYV